MNSTKGSRMSDQRIGNAYQTQDKEEPYFSIQPLPITGYICRLRLEV